MKIKIKREDRVEEFDVDKVTTLLDALYNIKKSQDSSLTFDAGCKSGVCGCCALRVNGKEVLACEYQPVGDELLEPLKYHEVKKDLLVQKSSKIGLNKKVNAYLKSYKDEVLSKEDENKTKVQTDCILCDSCYSACPVLEVNSNFAGPFALTRAYRYAIDKRDNASKDIIDSIQKDAIWDCTLCGECTIVCPMGIDPKSDIMQLRNLSAKEGYMDPNFANMGFGGGFGFDPNGGFGG